MQAKIIAMQVILHSDLANQELYNLYDRLSVGDAEYTLVHPSVLIEELEEQEDESLQPLIDELKTVPDCVLIALDG